MKSEEGNKFKEQADAISKYQETVATAREILPKDLGEHQKRLILNSSIIGLTDCGCQEYSLAINLLLGNSPDWTGNAPQVIEKLYAELRRVSK